MYNKSIVYRTLRDFYQNEQGTYVLLTGVMSVVLISVIALATDGSGLLLDRSRLSQGLEQAGLALIAENNASRSDKDETTGTGVVEGHTYLNNTKSDNSGKVDYKQRDQQLLKGYINAYLPDAKIENDFDYNCEQDDKDDPRSVTCTVEGGVKRVSWLPLNNNLSFKPEVDLSSGKVTVSKTLDELMPLDLMLVADLSGSMNRDTNGKKSDESGYSGTSKIDNLRNVVTSVSKDLLEKESPEVSPYNRIRFVSFTFGATQVGVGSPQCYLPYELKNKTADVANGGTKFTAWLDAFKSSNSNKNEEKYKARGEFLNGVVEGIDYAETVKKIETFKGEYIDYPIHFNKNAWCFGEGNTSVGTSKDWYGKGKGKELQEEFKKIEPSGATLSSSGMLIGANLLMDDNKDSKAKPSEVKANTQRILLILSDGKDQIYDLETAADTHKPHIEKFPELTNTTITEKLINAGACEAIRERLDGLQDSNYKKRPSRIHFVAFGYGPEGTQKEAWLKCVGDKDNYHVAKNEKELLETFRHIVNKREEVGKIIPTNY